MKRRILESVGFVGLLGALAFAVMTYYMAGIDPELAERNQALAGEIARLETRADQMRSTIRGLKVEVERLRSGDEERVHQARANLGMIHSGERVYQFEDALEGARRK